MKLQISIPLLIIVMASGCGETPAAKDKTASAPEDKTSIASEENIANAPQDSAANIALSEASSAINTEKCVSAEGHEILPDYVCFTEPYPLRNERTWIDKNGRNRRRVTFGYTGDDAETTASNVSKAFAVAGYDQRPRRDAADGSIQIPFAKEGLSTTLLIVKSFPSTSPPEGQSNSGSFIIDFEITPNQD